MGARPDNADTGCAPPSEGRHGVASRGMEDAVRENTEAVRELVATLREAMWLSCLEKVTAPSTSAPGSSQTGTEHPDIASDIAMQAARTARSQLRARRKR
jgi:hypothetical protein